MKKYKMSKDLKLNIEILYFVLLLNNYSTLMKKHLFEVFLSTCEYIAFIGFFHSILIW